MGAEVRLPTQLSANRRIVICGSMTFYGYMSRIREQLLTSGVEAIIPDAEDHLIGALPPNELEELRRSMALAHIRRVRNPRTFGVLAVNFDKYGLEDYIGPSTFAEIAIAAVHGKRIFVLNEFPRVYEEELTLWRAIPLCGRLEPLVSLYREACNRPTRQLNMFAA